MSMLVTSCFDEPVYVQAAVLPIELKTNLNPFVHPETDRSAERSAAGRIDLVDEAVIEGGAAHGTPSLKVCPKKAEISSRS